MLQDLTGWYRRNVKKMNAWQLKKELKQINQMQNIIEKQLKELGEAV